MRSTQERRERAILERGERLQKERRGEERERCLSLSLYSTWPGGKKRCGNPFPSKYTYHGVKSASRKVSMLMALWLCLQAAFAFVCLYIESPGRYCGGSLGSGIIMW